MAGWLFSTGNARREIGGLITKKETKINGESNERNIKPDFYGSAGGRDARRGRRNSIAGRCRCSEGQQETLVLQAIRQIEAGLQLKRDQVLVDRRRFGLHLSDRIVGPERMTNL